MALSPAFIYTPRIGAVTMAASDSSYTNPINFSTLITGASSGTQITNIIAKYTRDNTSGSITRIFLYDGTTYYLYDELLFTTTTGTINRPAGRVRAVYDNLILPSNSWSIRVTNSISQRIHIIALGFDL